MRKAVICIFAAMLILSGLTLVTELVEAGPTGQPSAPSGTPGVGNVSLAWQAPTDSGGFAVSGYLVYRSVSGGSEAQIASVASNAFLDATALPGVTYSYKVVAVNAKGSGLPASVSATALHAPPAPTEITIERHGQSVVLSWAEPVLNETTAPVTGYAIYRTLPSGQEVLLAIINGSSITTYTDLDAPEGEVSYRVATVTIEGTVDAASVSYEVIVREAKGGVGEALLVVALSSVGAALVLFLVWRRWSRDD